MIAKAINNERSKTRVAKRIGSPMDTNINMWTANKDNKITVFMNSTFRPLILCSNGIIFCWILLWVFIESANWFANFEHKTGCLIIFKIDLLLDYSETITPTSDSSITNWGTGWQICHKHCCQQRKWLVQGTKQNQNGYIKSFNSRIRAELIFKSNIRALSTRLRSNRIDLLPTSYLTTKRFVHFPSNLQLKGCSPSSPERFQGSNQ